MSFYKKVCLKALDIMDKEKLEARNQVAGIISFNLAILWQHRTFPETAF